MSNKTMSDRLRGRLSADDIEELGAAYVVRCVADKWKLYVIRALSRHDQLRFGELRRSLGSVSQKVLTQTLRRMETDGLVTRTVFAEVPPRVVYALTPLGKSLQGALMGLCKWAREHLDELREAEARAKKLTCVGCSVQEDSTSGHGS